MHSCTNKKQTNEITRITARHTGRVTLSLRSASQRSRYPPHGLLEDLVKESRGGALRAAPLLPHNLALRVHDLVGKLDPPGPVGKNGEGRVQQAQVVGRHLKRTNERTRVLHACVCEERKGIFSFQLFICVV